MPEKRYITRLTNEIELIKYFVSHGIKNEWTSRERIISLLEEFHILSGNLIGACHDAIAELEDPNRGPSGTQPGIDRLKAIIKKATPK